MDDLFQVAISNLVIKIPRRDDLALLRDLDAAPNAARRLGEDGLVGRTAAAPDGPAAPVEQTQGDPMPRRDLGQPLLGDVQFPVGRDIPAVLVGIRVADHHLLLVASRRDVPAIDRIGKQRVQDTWGVLQIGDGFKERHDIHRRVQRATLVLHQPRFLGEQQQGQHVGDGPRHRHDERPERLRPYRPPRGSH